MINDHFDFNKETRALATRDLYKHYPTDRIAHITALVETRNS